MISRRPFETPPTFWSAERYERQWREGIDRLRLGLSRSCLITSLIEPGPELFGIWWKLYYEGEQIVVQNHLAGDVSAAVVVLCRALIRGAAWTEALEVAAVARQPASQAAMSLAIRPGLKSGGFAPDVLRTGIFFVDRQSSFETALSEALRFAVQRTTVRSWSAQSPAHGGVLPRLL